MFRKSIEKKQKIVLRLGKIIFIKILFSFQNSGSYGFDILICGQFI